MKFFALALFPFVVAGVVLTFAGVEDVALRATLVKVEIVGAKVLALGGSPASATASSSRATSSSPPQRWGPSRSMRGARTSRAASSSSPTSRRASARS
jgi:hypothetical protein